MNLGHGADTLPDLLADLVSPDDEVFTAVADLHELGLITGTKSFGPAHHPVVVWGLRLGVAGVAVDRDRAGLFSAARTSRPALRIQTTAWRAP